MRNKFKKSIALCCMLVLCAISALNAQVIYFGGNNDGFAKGSYSESDPARDIFAGGINDGFAKGSFIETDPATDIFAGGNNDGFAVGSYSDPDPNNIFNGGIQDGFAIGSYDEPDPNNIFGGGVNDGFALGYFSETNPALEIYKGGMNDGFAVGFFNEELALPVDWKYFEVVKIDGRPLLRWGADNEQKCISYEVLRSHDGKVFESITDLSCHGNAFNNVYEFQDTSPLWHRIYYYKIAQYDVDGQFTHSPVRAFRPAEPSKPEVFYKNGNVIIKTDRETKLHSVAVYDFSGRTLCRQRADREAQPFYVIDCHLAPNQLVIIQMVFESFSSSVHMRIGQH